MRNSVVKAGLFIAFSSLLLCLSSCQDPHAIERARLRGANAGRIDGQAAGKTDGYNATYGPTRDDTYKKMVGELYDANTFGRKRSYTLTVIAVAFLTGFGLQYFIYLLLRKKELLFDIDRIVLPKSKTRINLREIPTHKPRALTSGDKRHDDRDKNTFD